MTANVAATYEGLKLEYKILADDFINMLSRRQNETLQEVPDVSKRIGIAKGEFTAPEDFDANNDEVYAMLMESASKLRIFF